MFQMYQMFQGFLKISENEWEESRPKCSKDFERCLKIKWAGSVDVRNVMFQTILKRIICMVRRSEEMGVQRGARCP